MNSEAIRHFTQIYQLKADLFDICKVKYKLEMRNIWSRWIITNYAFSNQKSPILPSSVVEGDKFIMEMTDKGSKYSHSKYVYHWLLNACRQLNKNFSFQSDHESGGIHGTNPISINHIDDYIILSSGNLRYKLSHKTYDRLVFLFKSRESFLDPNIHILVTGILYDILDGPGLQWSVPRTFFKYIQSKLDCQTELFASPFNHTLKNYYSMFPLDKHFCSKGNFFGAPDTDFKRGCYEVNPPFIESVFNKVTSRINHLLQIAYDNGEDLTFIYVMPLWTKFDTYEMVTSNMFCISNTKLAPYSHYYYDSSNNKDIIARFGTAIIVLSTNNDLVINAQDIINTFRPASSFS
jgi:hypothetical protein